MHGLSPKGNKRGGMGGFALQKTQGGKARPVPDKYLIRKEGKNKKLGKGEKRTLKLSIKKISRGGIPPV